MAVSSGVLKRNPNYQPSPPVQRISGLNGAMPTAYDPLWQQYNDLSPAQIAAFQSFNEWQNVLTLVAASPMAYTQGMPVAAVSTALGVAGKTALQTGLTITPAPVVTNAPTVSKPSVHSAS